MLTILLALLSLPLWLPAFALLALTLAGVRRPPSTPSPPASGGAQRLAVLVPAHNESAHVVPTVACLLPQLAHGDRVLVVADNCSDDTAAQARAAGALVTERHDPIRRGKGYALDHGVRWLEADPPDIVMVLDADCTVTPNALVVVRAEVGTSGQPLQLLNLMHPAPGAGLKHRMLAFAMVMKNHVRAQGAARLGGSCHLMGTGMAMPWALIAQAPLATGHVAEDMKLGVDLAVAGHPTRFAAAAEVRSAFPEETADAKVQKSRWEHGHLATLGEQLPQLLRASLRHRSWPLAVLALDLMIPPLALYVLVAGAAALTCLLLALVWPLWTGAAGLGALAMLALALSIALGWFTHGRHLLSAAELATAPLYALWKIPIYVAYALRRRAGWTRARRP